jgi:glycosyltransferase involved in cell wall biosynthesis
LDVFVLPSLSESCPNVLIEAQGVGVPAVCSDVGGVREILEDGRLGRLVPPAEPEPLAREVCAVLEDLEAARRVASRGRASALRRFTVDNKVDGTLRVYRRLLAEEPGRRG